MHLYLVQHAEPRRKEEDPQRPLTEKGRADILKVAAFISEGTHLKPFKILYSGKTRARQTAELLAERLLPKGGVEAAEDLDPMADPSIWVHRLNRENRDLMLVGHLPHLSKLTARLICNDERIKIIDYQMGGVVCLGRDEESSWFVQWVVVPAMVIE